MARHHEIQILQPEDWLEAQNGLLSFDKNFSDAALSVCNSISHCHGVLDYIVHSYLTKFFFASAVLYFVWSAIKKESKTRQVAILLGIVGFVLLGDFVANQIKYAMGRLRPYHDINVVNLDEISFSFPSNHAFTTGLMAYVFVILYSLKYLTTKKPILIFALISLVISLCRVFQGSHYPTDVLGAWIISGLYAFIFIRTYFLIIRSCFR